jgi:hypothetical protein
MKIESSAELFQTKDWDESSLRNQPEWNESFKMILQAADLDRNLEFILCDESVDTDE